MNSQDGLCVCFYPRHLFTSPPEKEENSKRENRDALGYTYYNGEANSIVWAQSSSTFLHYWCDAFLPSSEYPHYFFIRAKWKFGPPLSMRKQTLFTSFWSSTAGPRGPSEIYPTTQRINYILAQRKEKRWGPDDIAREIFDLSMREINKKMLLTRIMHHTSHSRFYSQSIPSYIHQ